MHDLTLEESALHVLSMSPPKQTIVILGKINGWPVRILLDTGSTDSFVNLLLIRNLGLKCICIVIFKTYHKHLEHEKVKNSKTTLYILYYLVQFSDFTLTYVIGLSQKYPMANPTNLRHVEKSNISQTIMTDICEQEQGQGNFIFIDNETWLKV